MNNVDSSSKYGFQNKPKAPASQSLSLWQESQAISFEWLRLSYSNIFSSATDKWIFIPYIER